MVFIPMWNCVMFLASPVLADVRALDYVGLFLTDLPLHDSSRDLVLAGSQQSNEIKLAFEKEKQRCKELESTMKQLDAMMKKSDQLMYQMIPKQVADRLKDGMEPIDTCQHFDKVTILFSDVVGFTSICSEISPMQVVTMLNQMYTTFDLLIEEHGVYKVETIGDAYMVVSGLPEKNESHADAIITFALAMIDVMTSIENPVTGGHLQIRIGVHSGSVVAGVVGAKMPRYCLFGDTVNTASRMESNSEPMKIHISEMTRKEIENLPYVVQRRGTLEVKGKGAMNTFWLVGRHNEINGKQRELSTANSLRRHGIEGENNNQDETMRSLTVPDQKKNGFWAHNDEKEDKKTDDLLDKTYESLTADFLEKYFHNQQNPQNASGCSTRENSPPLQPIVVKESSCLAHRMGWITEKPSAALKGCKQSKICLLS